ncbi:MAG TPA: dihydrolipoamide acetyltransferase family protein [Sporichthya sp.]|jgi:pyruvate dehydrogenase E2 component (dihydrolipoamide acetyltransferase)|nr:dihydrolipoamide acetyltransferase family protein [Sporichthya sp.]
MSEGNGSTDFCMPALGADMEKGTLLEWYVKPGDPVHRGQVIADVDTEKSAIEVEVWTDGIVDEICVPEGAEVPVGTVLARLRPAVPSAVAPAAPAAPAKVPPQAAPRVQPKVQPPARPRVQPPTRPAVPGAMSAAPRVRSSPLVRRRAAQAGIDLAAIPGTGPGGAVVSADLERALAGTHPQSAHQQAHQPAPEPVPEPAAERTPRPRARRSPTADGMRESIARLMTRSKREIPHYYLSTTIDVGPALAWLRERNAGLEVTERLLPVALLLKATALAASEYPDMNGHYVDGRHHPAPTVRLGVPVALRSGGLVTPIVDAAEQLSVFDLNRRLRDVATRARQGALRASDLAEPTLSVTNLGDQGVEAVFGVIYPPQVALVGFGAVSERPWAHDGLLGVRPLVTATLAADHRVSDGHRGGLFLTAVAERLAHPEEL